ncbi:MAG TPA: DUF883 domain-containing protein [Burkholderiaceae bacterium]|jgi:ElaB/YqjD/DUF883 family membrane-anchored ribosome-binding protein|nr:DUF883 domain-containing protein [Burkholderiaceae bacterium]
MSANFPPGLSENVTDTSNRVGTEAGAAGSSAYRTAKSTAKQGAAVLREDLANLKNDLEALMGRASSLSDAELSDAYGKMMTKFSSMRYAAKGMAAEAGRQLNQGVDYTTSYVKDKPLQSVAIASGIGLVLGMLMKRH